MTSRIPIQPGQLYIHNTNKGSFFPSSFRIITWNIQRGFQYHSIITYLKRIQPDILFLQEVDWGNGRTAFRNIAYEIANMLNLNYVYAAKSEEIDKWTRALFPKEGKGGGVIGNAILSRFTLLDPYVIDLPLEHIYQGMIPSRSTFREWIAPRKGVPIALSASIKNEQGHTVQLYCVHLDIFRTGITSREAQFLRVYADTKDKPHALICGDFNTAAHGAFGIGNFLENQDAFYLKNIFTPEAIYWQEHIIPKTEFVDPYDKRKDWTLHIGNIYQAKLDWILGKGVKFTNTYVGQDDSSDHFPLITDILLKE